jgi:hypothetical protein
MPHENIENELSPEKNNNPIDECCLCHCKRPTAEERKKIAMHGMELAEMIPWTKRHCKNCDKYFIFCSGHFPQNNSCPDCESTLSEVQPNRKRYATKDNEAYCGIKIPISFRYSYRGIKDAVLEVYFSPHPVSEDSIKSIAILRSITEENAFKSPHFKNGIEHLETHSTHGVINHLVPYKILENENSKNRQGILSSLNIDRSNSKLADKYLNNIPLIDKNPSTGTYNDIIGLFPAKDSDLDTLLQAFNHPPFYISINDGIFVLKIRCNDNYYSIPSQHYCPPNINKLPTPTISLAVRDQKTKNIVNLHPVWDYKDIEWETVAKDIIESNNEKPTAPNIDTEQS